MSHTPWCEIQLIIFVRPLKTLHIVYFVNFTIEQINYVGYKS